MSVKRILFPFLLGLSGVAVLLWLGFWQVDRLGWKQAILADLADRLATDPTPLSLEMTEAGDEYRPVTVTGTTTGEELHVLASGTGAGTGYRVIAAFETDNGARIMVDMGLLDTTAKDVPPQPAAQTITGVLLWPDDQNSSTPDPDLAANIWFARNTETMAGVLQTQPFMIVANASLDPRLTPLPVNSANIKNDHLEYAITWFLLAAVWAAMTGYLILRTLRQKDT